jgi:hypothetical protein
MITADATTLMRQAPMTAEVYMLEAVKCINERFGMGYAKDHPDLVAAFMYVAGNDFNAAIQAQAISEAAQAISEAAQAIYVTP